MKAELQQPAELLADLELWETSIDEKTPAQSVEDLFAGAPELPGVVVMDGDRVAGVLSRRAFHGLLSRPFSRELYLKKPIATSVQALGSDVPFVMAADTPVASAVESALARPPEHVYEPVIVQKEGVFFLLQTDVLLRAQSSILAQANNEKDTLLDELRETVERLKQAQDRLVQTEKMAALGQLVAGVAHEINTPIGVALTAASHLSERTEAFTKLFSSGAIKRSDLTHYAELAKDSAELLQFNIRRAAQLIQSFKQVAVDQASEQRRSFDLGSYLSQLSASLAPEVRKSGNTLQISCDENIEVDSFPGALAQVLSNLIQNAIVHAYDGDHRGEIIVTATQCAKDVEIRVEDQGKGIPSEHLARVFDPFFTTKRGSGGSGLGLHIVYNIVTETLCGRISCSSEVGRGTRFTVTAPLSPLE